MSGFKNIGISEYFKRYGYRYGIRRMAFTMRNIHLVKDYENKKLCNFRSKKLKRKYLQIFHGKKIYIGNYSDRTRADISYCHSASVDL